MPTLPTSVLIVTAITTSLIAGLFYAWSCSVTLGLRNVPDSVYIQFMQAANKAIQNPVFFTSFLGTAILLPASTFLHYDKNVSFTFWLLLIAMFIYLAGVMCVTIFGNIPLNNALDGFDVQMATEKSIAAQRLSFEGRWNFLNTLRTISSIFSLILVIIACIYHQEPLNTK